MALTSVESAKQQNEPLYGTIKSADVWFLLEYNGIYTNQAWEDARIPSEVKTKLEAYPNSRPLLIRQPNQLRQLDRKTTFFIVHTKTDNPTIYHFELENYDALLAIDIDDVLAGNVHAPHPDPLYVICTNGKRDMCCSKYGVALYNAMIKHDPINTWQASHIGGHRFAGTMYCFPHALCYGFLTEDDALSVVQSYRHNEILLDKLRGRAIYDKFIQAAEYFLRRELDNTDLDDVIYQSHQAIGETWSVKFRVGGTDYQVNLEAGTPIQVIATTGDETYKSIPQFTFVDYHTA